MPSRPLNGGWTFWKKFPLARIQPCTLAKGQILSFILNSQSIWLKIGRHLINAFIVARGLWSWELSNLL